MILAHLSDLHLGFRAFERRDRGRNLREVDVARAFQAAVRRICQIGPDLVLIAGDVFDRPEPSQGALVTLARGLETLRDALPDTTVLMVAGSRDTPHRPGEPGALAAFDAFPGVEAATTRTREVELPNRDARVVLVPHRAALGTDAPPVGERGAKWNLLLAYGEVVAGGEALPLRASDWDYVALGHRHTREALAAHVHYSGSLERVGAAPWNETPAEKGFLSFDLERGASAFHPIAGRPVVSLAPIRLEPERRSRLRERVAEVLDEVPGGIDGKIVRLRLQGLAPTDTELLLELLQDYRERALHLEVSLEDEPAPGEQARPGLAASLTDRLALRGSTSDMDQNLLRSVVEEALGADVRAQGFAP